MQFILRFFLLVCLYVLLDIILFWFDAQQTLNFTINVDISGFFNE